MNKLVIDKNREFGDCIADGFKILGKNFKALITGFMVYIFPLLMIVFLLLFYFGKPLLEDFESNFSSMPVVLVALYGGMFFGFMMVCAVVYSIFLAYLENDNQKVSFNDIQPYILPCFWRIIPVFLLSILIYIIPMGLIIALSSLNPAYFFLIIPLLVFFFYVMAPLMLAPFIRVQEGIGVFQSFSRAFTLIKDNWWATFGVIFVSSLIASMASYILLIPFYAITMFKSFSALDSGSIGEGTGIWAGITMIVAFVSYLFTTSYNIACTNFKYFDLVERKDGSALLNKIDEFGSKPESSFENEGEF
jgi:uncharacterized membrane protein